MYSSIKSRVKGAEKTISLQELRDGISELYNPLAHYNPKKDEEIAKRHEQLLHAYLRRFENK